MPQTSAQKLDSDDPFPPSTLQLVDGSTLELPSPQWTLFLIYRGRW